MLNNLTNFFNLITNRMMKKVPERTDLIILGTKHPRYGGGYAPTGITVEDFIAAIPIPPPVDPAVNYSNVAWVDSVNGSDITGTIGDFTKPFATVTGATNLASSFGFTSTNRGLVYVRRGTYTSYVNLSANVDTYCEPGVVFTAGGFFDTTTTGSVGIYGSAKFVNVSIPLVVTYSSTIYMEFDEADQANTSSVGSLGVLEIKPNAAYSCNVTVKCRKIKSYCANAYAVTVRGASNVNLTVEESIEGTYDPIYLRYSADGTNFSGTLNINCPKIITADGGWAGNLATYKSGIKIFRVASTAKITINGNFVNNCLSYYGTGVCAISASAGTQETVILNGNINSLYGGGLNVSGTGSKYMFRGSMNVGAYPVLTNSTAEAKIMNSDLVMNTLVGYATVGTLAGSSKVYFINTSIVNPNGSNITNSNPTSYVYHYNTQTYSSSLTPGFFANGGNVGVVKSISNAAGAGTNTNVFTTLDLTIDPLFKLPTF